MLSMEKRILTAIHDDYKGYEEIISWFSLDEFSPINNPKYCFEIHCSHNGKAIRSGWCERFSKAECEQLTYSDIERLVRLNIELVEESEKEKKSHRKAKKYTY